MSRTFSRFSAGAPTVVEARILLCYSDIRRKQGKPLPGERDPILHPYALLGFVLIFFRRASGRTLLIAGLLLAVIVPGACLAVHGALTTPADFEAARQTEEALHAMN